MAVRIKWRDLLVTLTLAPTLPFLEVSDGRAQLDITVPAAR